MTDSQGTALEQVPERSPAPRTAAGGRGRRKPPGPIGQTRTFSREVVAELRKVIWPSRNELVTYSVVVFVFVAFMVALVASLDYVLTQAVLNLFG